MARKSNLPAIRKPLPSDPLFEAICALAGDAIRHSAGSRVAALAVRMHKAGLTAERLLNELPGVVARYATYRRTLDIGTITSCWAWVLTPPVTIEKPGSFELAQRAVSEAGGHPWK